jgi:hypothetical protein
VVIGLSSSLPAQLVYTASFTRKIEKAGIDLYKPVEQWLHVYPLDKDSFMTYDLVLQNDINDFEVRYRLRPDKGKWRNTPNEIEFKRLLSSLPTNDLEASIRTYFPDSTFARDNYNAASCYFADFIPKASYTEKPYATLVCLRSDQNVSVDIILLHYDPEYDPMESFRNLRFQ